MQTCYSWVFKINSVEKTYFNLEKHIYFLKVNEYYVLQHDYCVNLFNKYEERK